MEQDETLRIHPYELYCLECRSPDVAIYEFYFTATGILKLEFICKNEHDQEIYIHIPTVVAFSMQLDMVGQYDAPITGEGGYTLH